MDFDLCIQKCRVSNYNSICLVCRALFKLLSFSSCNKYLNLTQHKRIQFAHFVRYSYIRGRRGDGATTDGEFSETRLKLGTKCRANLFLRGVFVHEKSISKIPDARSGISDTFRITVTSTFMISVCFF